MLVYGDRAVRRATADVAAEIARRLAAVAAAPPGIGRHGGLVSAFVVAAALAQGIADAEFDAEGTDRRTPAQDSAMAFLTALAGAVWTSWRSGLAELPPLPVLALSAPPATVVLRLAEGHAFYALYPEAYAAAAAALPDAALVVGIRSIGAGLAAMAAAASGAGPPVTVRPVGHPFRRTLALAPALRDELAAAPVVAVVDEGPGLSGSSFAAVVAALGDAGGGDRVHILPGHAGDPGAEASPQWRARWRTLSRHVVPFERLILHADHPAHCLSAWIEAEVGPLAVPLTDISGGAWRAERFGDEAHWPPANTHAERRKFLARTADGPVLAKFAGLGPTGEGSLALAAALGRAGVAPEPVGLIHGFLLERWHGDARPLRPSAAGLAEPVGRYLAARATRLDAALPVPAGAALSELVAMAERNTALALGDAAAAALAVWRPRLGDLAAHVRPVATDNRMHAWEWLALPDGRLLKSDAVDHCRAHDLVGCQDIAWDIVGAEIELGLDAAGLSDAVAAATGRPVPPDLTDVLRLCYLAFQLGAFTLAADAHGNWPAEAARLARRAAFYRTALARRLAATPPRSGPTPRR